MSPNISLQTTKFETNNIADVIADSEKEAKEIVEICRCAIVMIGSDFQLLLDHESLLGKGFVQ